MSDFKPTLEQAAIVAAVLRGENIIVNALAGAAKTSTIEMAAKAMPFSQHNGSLALAFNVKIKDELSGRLPFQVSTINGLGHKAWMGTAGKMELSSDKMANIRKKLFAGDQRLPWAVSKIASMAKMSGLVPNEFGVEGIIADKPSVWQELMTDEDLDPKHWIAARAILVESIKQAKGEVIDFDDQVYMPVFFGGRFMPVNVLMVDEAQDLSPLNHLLLTKLKFKQLVVVGDPLQSIYGFRGADSDSMPKLQSTFDLIEYKLTTCFRCSKKVAGVARYWAEEIKSPEWAKEGSVSNLLDPDEDEGRDTWNINLIGGEVTVLCRNNAPLIKMALKVFKKEPIKFINGRAASTLTSLLRQIVNYKKMMTASDVVAKIESYRAKKLETEDEKKHEGIIDQTQSLEYCAEGAETLQDIEDTITKLFQGRDARVTFGTGHSAKGLEWDSVIHLDSFRIPSKFARSAKALQQEENLAYVITTRAKINLYYADLGDYA